MNEYIGRLEKLAELKTSGVLTDDEFAAEKAALLQGGSQRSAARPERAHGRPLSRTWQKRFDFFDQYGSPLSLAAQDRLREMSFSERCTVALNVPCMLLGPFYLLFLGLWRHALLASSFVIIASFGADDRGVPERYQDVLFVGFWIIYSVTANYAYYLKRTTGRESWNPVEVVTARSA